MSTEIKAVLVRLSIRIFTNSRQDPRITDEVRLQKALGQGAGKWIKHIFPDEAFKEIREIGGNARRRSYDLTLPWEDGQRLLPAKAHEGYQSEIESYKNQFWKAVDAFGEDYDRWVKESRKLHGKTFDENLYPDWKTMRSKYFSFGIEFIPVPAARHFINSGIAADAIEEMKAELEEHNQLRVQQAVEDTWNRLMLPVKALAEKLADKEAIFRDTLVENVKEIVALIPSLNLTNDNTLIHAAQEIEKSFASLDVEILRTDKVVRKATADAAKKLLSNFGAVGKRRFA